MEEAAVWKIAKNYTKEAGVRQLERKIGEICRKTAKEILTTERKKVTITKENLSEYLGREKYTYEMANSSDEIGIVRGLAWTSVGGDTLQIEVNVMPGKGELLLTGQLGDVMKESAQTGISYIRSVGKSWQIADDFFEKHDLHVHIPEGAVPKDGPSAGDHDGDGNLVGGNKEKDPGGSGDDRRDHTAGKSASDRRAERETACGEECWNTYGSDPGAQSGGRGRVFIRDHRRTFHSPGKKYG